MLFAQAHAKRNAKTYSEIVVLFTCCLSIVLVRFSTGLSVFYQLSFPKIICVVSVQIREDKIKDIRVPVCCVAFNALLDVLRRGQLRYNVFPV